jgi:hypothetical protein
VGAYEIYISLLWIEVEGVSWSEQSQENVLNRWGQGKVKSIGCHNCGIGDSWIERAPVLRQRE